MLPIKTAIEKCEERNMEVADEYLSQKRMLEKLNNRFCFVYQSQFEKPDYKNVFSLFSIWQREGYMA